MAGPERKKVKGNQMSETDAVTAASDEMAALKHELNEVLTVAARSGVGFAANRMAGEFSRPYAAGSAAGCRQVIEQIRQRIADAQVSPLERQRRQDLAWQQSRALAADAAETERWVKLDPHDVIAEIEKGGARRVFLADDGAVMVRGRGTAPPLKAALRHHQRIVRVILADRDAVEEIIPAPDPSAPATQAA
jgi:hypothetical protein